MGCRHVCLLSFLQSLHMGRESVAALGGCVPVALWVLGEMLCIWRHLAAMGRECGWHPADRGWGAALHPTIHRADSTAKTHPANTSIVSWLRNPAVRGKPQESNFRIRSRIADTCGALFKCTRSGHRGSLTHRQRSGRSRGLREGRVSC